MSTHPTKTIVQSDSHIETLQLMGLQPNKIIFTYVQREITHPTCRSTKRVNKQSDTTTGLRSQQRAMFGPPSTHPLESYRPTLP